MRWFTCTPVPFGGGPDFFARDSGLLSRGFQSIGVESHALMPGERQAVDEADLIRTDYSNLESSAWWREQGLDGVVLYAWGRPKYLRVARAIHQAGIFLVLNQDSGGLVSPLNGLGAWLGEQRVVSGGGMPYLKRAAYGLSAGLAISDPLRALHLRQGNIIAAVSPGAADHYRRLCGIYGGSALAKRVEVVPHPIHTRFDFSGGKKGCAVVVIGRWDVPLQKRTPLMMAAIAGLVAADPKVEVEIIGTCTPEMKVWHTALGDGASSRVQLRGHLLPEGIAPILAVARVSYCPSAFESFHIASGEALCSGCSVVAADSPSLASFPWFCGDGSGALILQDDAAGHVKALRDELAQWDAGERDPARISTLWKSRLHAPEVARQILALAGR